MALPSSPHSDSTSDVVAPGTHSVASSGVALHMWTVLFGDHERVEEEEEEHREEQEERDVAAASARAAAVKTHALLPKASTPPVTPVVSPVPLVPVVDPHVGAPIEVKHMSRREESEDTAMAMLLKRLNKLMVKVGQHEFEKKTLVDQVSGGR